MCIVNELSLQLRYMNIISDKQRTTTVLRNIGTLLTLHQKLPALVPRLLRSAEHNPKNSFRGKPHQSPSHGIVKQEVTEPLLLASQLEKEAAVIGVRTLLQTTQTRWEREAPHCSYLLHHPRGLRGCKVRGVSQPCDQRAESQAITGFMHLFRRIYIFKKIAEPFVKKIIA